jgi:hypothetical protein
MREGNATLKLYKGYPHDMATIHADVINADLLACIRSSWRRWHEWGDRCRIGRTCVCSAVEDSTSLK